MRWAAFHSGVVICVDLQPAPVTVYGLSNHCESLSLLICACGLLLLYARRRMSKYSFEMLGDTFLWSPK